MTDSLSFFLDFSTKNGLDNIVFVGRSFHMALIPRFQPLKMIKVLTAGVFFSRRKSRNTNIFHLKPFQANFNPSLKTLIFSFVQRYLV